MHAGNAPRCSVVVHEVQQAAVGEVRDGEVHRAQQRGLVIERGADDGTGPGEEALVPELPVPLGHVAQDHGKEPPSGEVEARDGGLGRELRPVTTPADDFLSLSHAPRHVGAFTEARHVPRM